MGFVEAVRTCLFRKFFQFRGRAARAEYWWFVVFGAILTGSAALAGTEQLAYLVAAVLFLPQLSVTARRLHDTDRSAWWVLLLAPGWLDSLSYRFFPEEVWTESLVFFLGLLITGLVLFWFMVQKGDAGENRFGPDPVPDPVLGLHGPPPRNDG